MQLLTTLLVLLGLHVVVYRMVASAFRVSGFWSHAALLLVPLFLTMSFVFSALLHRLERNTITSAYCLISALWIGLLIHLLMASAVFWLVLLAARTSGATMDARAVCVALILTAIAATGYGAWNAREPVLRTVDIEVRDLPAQWLGSTIVQLSDVHLGTIRRTGYLERIVSRVNALEPALILITGDLFDGMGNDFEPFVEPLNELRAKHGVFFVTGNHEGYLGLKKPLEILSRTHIQVLDNEVVEIDSLQLVGIGFPEHDREDQSQRALELGSRIDAARPSILLFHTPTEVEHSSQNRGEQQGRTYFSPSTSFRFATDNGIDLQLSGHTHQGQIFPFTLLTRWIYRGYDHGLHRIGDFQLYTTSGTGTWGPPLRTGSSSEIVAFRLR